jgi:hypothetical protein
VDHNSTVKFTQIEVASSSPPERKQPLKLLGTQASTNWFQTSFHFGYNGGPEYSIKPEEHHFIKFLHVNGLKFDEIATELSNTYGQDTCAPLTIKY